MNSPSMRTYFELVVVHLRDDAWAPLLVDWGGLLGELGGVAGP